MTLTPYKSVPNMWYRESIESGEKFGIRRWEGYWIIDDSKNGTSYKKTKSCKRAKTYLDNELIAMGYKLLTEEEWEKMKILI